MQGCNVGILQELVGPVAGFGLSYIDSNDYYSKECLWYEQVKFTNETKDWLKGSSPPVHVVKDLAKVARNNDIYKEVCDNVQ